MLSTRELIYTIESENNPHAIRFEPDTYRRYTQIYTSDKRLIAPAAAAKLANKCSIMTALNIASTSYGRYQIMGFNLYGPELKFNGDVVQFMQDVNAQDDVFDKFLSSRKINFTIEQLAASEEARVKFAHLYNGSELYAVKMLDVLKKFWVM